jgi:hypothetical protein
MRRLLVPLLLIAAAFPAVGFAVRTPAPDGTLAVRDGRGKVQLDKVKGSIIGRFANGSITIEELSPDEGTEPVVRGYKSFRWGRNGNTRTYTGKNVRFRLIGGRYRVLFNGRGLFFSLVGRGRVMLDGNGSLPDGVFYDGFYSLNGTEEESLPDEPTWLGLAPVQPPPPPPSPPAPRPSPSS